MGKINEDPRYEDENESLKKEIKSLIRQYRKKDRPESDCKIIGELLAIYANASIGKKQREKVVGWLINRMLKKKTKTIVWEKLYIFLHSKVETLNEKNRGKFISATESADGGRKISQLRRKMENLQRKQRSSK